MATTTEPGAAHLIGLVRAEIARDGPITFARFMQRALYEPDLGYYATSQQRTTRTGDYLTAPELHPIFGQALAEQLLELRQRLGDPAAFTVREFGAGRATIAKALPARMAYQPVEFADAAPAAPLTGVILANELLDALPVHRVVHTDDGLRELYVSWHDGAFVEQAGPLSDRRLESWFAERGIELAVGQRTEVNLVMLEWLAALPAQLERGYVLLIDYALPAVELYGPPRRSGTLRAFRAHRVSSAVLAGIGQQDLTATVDLDALLAGAEEAGLSVLGWTSQAKFLLGCGLERLMAEWRERLGEDIEGQLLLRSAVRRLLDPRALGNYAVVVLGKGVDDLARPRGLAFSLPTSA